MNVPLAIAGVVLREMIRRKDFYVLFILSALLTLLAGSVNLFNEPGIVRHVKEIALLLVWISTLVIAVTMAARQIPAEREQRTLLPLLAKPVTRVQLLVGKFLGCWFVCGLAVLAFYALLGAITVMRDPQVHWPGFVQAALLHWCLLGVTVAMALLGSVVLAAPSSTTTLCLIVVAGILGLGRHLHKVAHAQPEPVRTILQVIYYAIPHLEFFDMRDLLVHNWPPVPWLAVLKAALYAAVYVALFLGAAWLVFRRKPVN